MHDRGHAALERPFPRQQLIQQHAGGIDVAAGVHHLALDLLGRHVGGRAKHGPRLRHVGAFDARDAEIGDLRLAAFGQHQVGGLDVPVHDATLMAELQTSEQILHDPHDHGQRKPLFFIENRFQRRAVHELHDDVGDTARLAIIEHADDVGMLQPPRRLRLPPEARDGFRRVLVLDLRQIDGLDRHHPFDDGVPAFAHRTHGPAAKLTPDFVFTEGLDL